MLGHLRKRWKTSIRVGKAKNNQILEKINMRNKAKCINEPSHYSKWHKCLDNLIIRQYINQQVHEFSRRWGPGIIEPIELGNPEVAMHGLFRIGGVVQDAPT